MTEMVPTPRWLMTVLALALLAGCASVQQQAVQPPASPCRTLFEQVDAAVEQHGVRDYGPAQITGFPYLRANRLLASFRDEVNTEERFAAWSHQLAALDAQARHIEVSNLAEPVAGMDDSPLLQKLDSCREQLIASELATPEMRQQLRKVVEVPDAYIGWWRAAGLYPITAPLVSSRVSKWHKETKDLFDLQLSQLPVEGSLTRWAAPKAVPLQREQVEALLKRQTDPLGLPILTAEETQQLFDTFAPVWEVDVVSDDDHIGTPYWSRKNLFAVNTGQPALYKLVSYTRFKGKVLLQLNYIVWFPARSGDDIYSGPLDGINWRVTLGPDGTPWLYDAMHNCGCYYEVFPSNHLKLHDDLKTAAYDEMPLQPQTAPEGLPVTLRIANATHFIQRVYHAEQTAGTTQMVWADYDSLRAMPAPGGTRSMFGEHGIVEASARRERMRLWPMGVRSAGAMRQWGQHAIAFVGRHHFDDAHLLEDLFEQTTP